MKKDILLNLDSFIFSYRVAGILIRGERILLQKPHGKEEYSIPGGHVAAGETAAEALVREFREELCAEIRADSLIAAGEIFFPWGGRPCHQLCLYYRVHLENSRSIPLEGTFEGRDELENKIIPLDFCWTPLSELGRLIVYPKELTPRISAPGDEIFHFVSRQL